MNAHSETNFEETLKTELLNCPDADISKWSGIFAFWRLNYSDSWETVEKYVRERDFGHRIDIDVVKDWYDFFANVKDRRYDYKKNIPKEMMQKYEYLKQVKNFPPKI